jgi:hypothetical protein
MIVLGGWAVVKQGLDTAHHIVFGAYIINICFDYFFDVITIV